MAKMVTRTINGLNVMARCYNTETELMEDVEILVSGTFSDDEKGNKKLNKAINSLLPTELTFVKVVDSKVVSQLYGMTEEDFVRFSTPINK